MPILGLSARLPIEEIVERLQNIQTALKARGVVFPDPLLTLITLTGAAIPFIRISEEGLVNLKNGQQEELIVELK
jgi:adenine deaminase